MLSRRTFITGSTITALCLGFGPAWSATRRATLCRADFEALIHGTFRVFDGQGQIVDCTLEGVRSGPIAPGLDQFTVVFRRSDGGETLRGLYELWHPKLRHFRLRLDPSVREGGDHVVAIFSQRTTRAD